MEDGGREGGVGTRSHGGREMLYCACTPGGNDGQVHGLPDFANQFQVEAFFRAVAVHGVQQNLPHAQFLAGAGPLDGVDACGTGTTVGGHLEAAGHGIGVGSGGAAGVDTQHNALRAEAFTEFPQQFGAGNGGGVHAHFIRPGAQQLVHVLHAAHPAADGEGNEHLLGGAAHHVQHGATPGLGSRDVEEGEFVGPLGVVTRGEFHRIARVAQVLEIDSLDHAAVVHVQAGDDAHRNAHETALLT